MKTQYVKRQAPNKELLQRMLKEEKERNEFLKDNGICFDEFQVKNIRLGIKTGYMFYEVITLNDEEYTI